MKKQESRTAFVCLVALSAAGCNLLVGIGDHELGVADGSAAEGLQDGTLSGEDARVPVPDAPSEMDAQNDSSTAADRAAAGDDADQSATEAAAACDDGGCLDATGAQGEGGDSGGSGDGSVLHDSGTVHDGGDGGGCVASMGQGCGSCGGTVQCGGACSVATPATYGQGCGSCGGTVRCNGTCSVATPATYGQGCGSCGGTVQCSGACSGTPSNYGQSCGSCGGTVQCNSSCSVSTPSNYGQSCGCGTTTCTGACSKLSTFGASCPTSSGTAITVGPDFGNYAIDSITDNGAPAGIYTFYTTAGDAGSVTLYQNGKAVSTISYIWQTTVSGSNVKPLLSYTFTFPGYLGVTVQAGSVYVNGTLNLYDLPASIFNDSDYISVCCP